MRASGEREREISRRRSACSPSLRFQRTRQICFILIIALFLSRLSNETQRSGLGGGDEAEVSDPLFPNVHFSRAHSLARFTGLRMKRFPIALNTHSTHPRSSWHPKYLSIRGIVLLLRRMRPRMRIIAGLGSLDLLDPTNERDGRTDGVIDWQF